MEQWSVFGQPVFVERKRIKNLYVYVKRPDGMILVSAPLWMKEEEIRTFLEQKRNWILKKQEAMVQEQTASGEKQGNGPLVPEPKEKRERKSRSRKYLLQAVPPLLEKWEPVMGVHAREWRLRDMKTRWGSCNVEAKRIWLSLMLAEKPPECLEYVVVHELCHLLEPSHNRVFWGYMTRFLPDWKERRTRLNQ